MDEKLVRNNPNSYQHEDLDKTLALNNLYLEAIQTKLKILDNL